jgi:tetratricopeptide (TPR) repeat protein
MSAASNLLRRSVNLLPESESGRVALLPTLSEALMESGEFATAESVLDEAVAAAGAIGDMRLLADATLSRLLVRRHADGAAGTWFAEVQRETRRLIPALEEQSAHAELAKAWRLSAFVHANTLRWQQAASAQQRAIEHARQAGRRRLEARMSAALAQALRDGPTPVHEAIRRCQDMLAAGLVDQQAEVLATLHLAYLHALAGDVFAARTLYQQARGRLSDLGGAALTAASVANITVGRIELLSGEAVTAATELRQEYDALGQIGERYFRPTIGALLGQALCEAGLYEEAAAVAREVEVMAPDDDVEAQAIWRAVQARALAADGRAQEGLPLVDEAVRMLTATDALVWKAEALMDQARVRIQAGYNELAVEALGRARELYALKGATLPLHGVDALLATITDAALRGRRIQRAARARKKVLVSPRN